MRDATDHNVLVEPGAWARSRRAIVRWPGSPRPGHPCGFSGAIHELSVMRWAARRPKERSRSERPPSVAGVGVSWTSTSPACDSRGPSRVEGPARCSPVAGCRVCVASGGDRPGGSDRTRGGGSRGRSSGQRRPAAPALGPRRLNPRSRGPVPKGTTRTWDASPQYRGRVSSRCEPRPSTGVASRGGPRRRPVPGRRITVSIVRHIVKRSAIPSDIGCLSGTGLGAGGLRPRPEEATRPASEPCPTGESGTVAERGQRDRSCASLGRAVAAARRPFGTGGRDRATARSESRAGDADRTGGDGTAARRLVTGRSAPRSSPRRWSVVGPERRTGTSPRFCTARDYVVPTTTWPSISR